MPQVVPTIFTEEAIRGQYPGELNEGSAYLLGRAFAQVLRARKVVLGRDARPSSHSLAASFTKGLLEEGVTVHDLGWASTPYLSFACQQADYDGSVMVTASHLPADSNGFLLTAARGKPLTLERGLTELRDLLRQGLPYRPVPVGTVAAKDYSTIYLDAITRQRIIKKCTVAIDTSNGMAGLVVPAILQRFPQVTLVPINFEIDGLFPGHVPNPLLPDALIKLKGAVRLNKCDLGVAFDGDGDQIAFITPQGELLPGDFVGVLLAQRQLLKHPAETILHDVRASWAVAEEVKKIGGRPIETRTGSGHIKQAMREQQAIFAADPSMHYYFKDFYGSDNADYALLEMLELLSEAQQPLQELVAPLKKYIQSGEISLPVTDPQAVLSAVATHFKNAQQKNLDGLSLTYPDWHLNIRSALAQPIVHFNLEAKSSALLKEKRNELAELLQPFVQPN
ncbi:MAG: phosphomannomutase/phosphoglucomutase [Candidatus Andersenbacteria bacterium]